MKISELMAALSARYPNQLGKQQQVDAWAEDYHRALPEGLKLAEAWDACRAKWTKATFPRPADIAQYLPRDESKHGDEKEIPNHSVCIFAWRQEMLHRYIDTATQEGWLRGLHSWIANRDNVLRPVITEAEIQAMTAADTAFWQKCEKPKKREHRNLGTAAKRVLADLESGEAKAEEVA